MAAAAVLTAIVAECWLRPPAGLYGGLYCWFVMVAMVPSPGRSLWHHPRKAASPPSPPAAQPPHPSAGSRHGLFPPSLLDGGAAVGVVGAAGSHPAATCLCGEVAPIDTAAASCYRWVEAVAAMAMAAMAWTSALRCHGTVASRRRELMSVGGNTGHMNVASPITGTGGTRGVEPLF